MDIKIEFCAKQFCIFLVEAECKKSFIAIRNKGISTAGTLEFPVIDKVLNGIKEQVRIEGNVLGCNFNTGILL